MRLPKSAAGQFAIVLVLSCTVALAFWTIRGSEYERVTNDCVHTLNQLSTLLHAEKTNRAKLWAKNTNIFIQLNEKVKGNIDAPFNKYYSAEDRYLRHRNKEDFKTMKEALDELHALYKAAQDIMETNSGTKLKL